MIRVLVVDDDFMVAKVHAAFVRRTPGFEVVGQAHTGADALTEAARLRPDLVLLDVYLPDMTGIQVLQRLRASPGPEAGVDVLMVTAARDAETVRTSLHGGASGYLIKPFTGEDLRARLERVAQARRHLESLAGGPGEDARQEDVDRLFAVAAPPAPAPGPLPKGLATETVTLVQQVLRNAGGAGLSAAECAEQTGLSRVSARRYLEHLAQAGQAEVRAKYGGPGRPERRFRLV